MRLRLPLPPSNESIVGQPQRWFAWWPVLVEGTIVWREWITRTRWHSPMGHWYWAYGPDGPPRLSDRELMQKAWGALNFILAFYEPGQRHLDTEAWKVAEAGARATRQALADRLEITA